MNSESSSTPTPAFGVKANVEDVEGRIAVEGGEALGPEAELVVFTEVDVVVVAFSLLRLSIPLCCSLVNSDSAPVPALGGEVNREAEEAEGGIAAEGGGARGPVKEEGRFVVFVDALVGGSGDLGKLVVGENSARSSVLLFG
jgi:hypothetical protein